MKFLKNDEKWILSIVGSFFEWFWTCGQQMFFFVENFENFWFLKNFGKNHVFLKNNINLMILCFLSYRSEKVNISHFKEKFKSYFFNYFLSIIRFFNHFGVFSSGSSSAFLFFHIFFNLICLRRQKSIFSST